MAINMLPSIGLVLFTGRFGDTSQQEALDDAIMYAQAAEAQGWDEIWITEHHFNPWMISNSAMTFAGYLLGITQRVQVATAISILPNHHPIALAEQASLLDRVSEGRLILGVGRGQPTRDLEILGRGVEVYQHGFDHDLEQLMHALRDHVGFPVVPTPRQMPVVVACTSSATVQATARHGLPMLLAFVQPPQVQAELLQTYAEAASVHGHDPQQVQHVHSVIVQVDESREAALETLKRGYVRWQMDMLAAKESLSLFPAPFQLDESVLMQMMASQAIGTPQECAETLVQLVTAFGTQHMVFIAEGAGKREATLRNIERISNEVVPALDKLLASA